MKRLFSLFILTMFFTLFCFSAAQADPGKTHLVFIGGDADYEECKNNIFRNMLIHNEMLQSEAEAFFVKSANKDYSNATAIQRTKEAEKFLSGEDRNVVAGYSHGGQSVFFLEAENISDIYLLDACVSIGGKCANPVSCGNVWSEWIIATAGKGINVHCYASIGKHDEPSGAKNAIRLIQERSVQDASLVDLGNGWYQVVDQDQNEAALIELLLTEGTHKDICITTEERITQYLFSGEEQ